MKEVEKTFPDILFEKIKAKDVQFNPANFFEHYDSEKYFELFLLWKGKYEKDHLESGKDLNLTDIKAA